jgi:DNA-binding transcriptional LysR family regulator
MGRVDIMSGQLTIRQLACFVAVAEELHFRRAAQRLHMSQPPLTQRIQAMERDLGVQLFKRIGRRTELTEVGRSVLTEARAALAQVERVRVVARQAEEGKTGTIRAAAVLSVAFTRAFNEATKAFRSDYPGVVLDLVHAHAGPAIDALRQRKIDFCLVRRPTTLPPELEQVTVAKDRLMLVLPSSHPKAGAEKISLSDIVNEPFISFPAEKVILHKKIVELWARAGFRPPVGQEGDNGLAILTLVASGFGNAILPSSLNLIQMPNLIWKSIDMDDQWTESFIDILYRPDALLENHLRRFIEYVRRYSSESSTPPLNPAREDLGWPASTRANGTRASAENQPLIRAID